MGCSNTMNNFAGEYKLALCSSYRFSGLGDHRKKSFCYLLFKLFTVIMLMLFDLKFQSCF